MTIKELCRDDLIGRFASHTFTETVIGSQTKVDFKDGSEALVASATRLDVNDAYRNIRENEVGDFTILFCLTTAQKDALTSTPDGTQLVDVSLNIVQTHQAGAWVGDASATETEAFTGTSLTLDDTHSGKRLTFDNASAITVTLDTGLKAGFTVELEQIGAGEVQVSANGTTINSLNGDTKTAGQYAVVKLLQTATDVFTFSGDTAS